MFFRAQKKEKQQGKHRIWIEILWNEAHAFKSGANFEKAKKIKW